MSTLVILELTLHYFRSNSWDGPICFYFILLFLFVVYLFTYLSVYLFTYSLLI